MGFFFLFLGCDAFLSLTLLLDALAEWDLLTQIEKTHLFALKSPWFQVREDLIELVLFLFLPAALKLPSLFLE